MDDEFLVSWMMKMSCEKYENQIALFITDDLPVGEAAVVAQHLHNCPACADFAEEMRESQAAFSFTDADEFSESLLSDLRDSVMNEVARRENARSFWQRLFHPLRWQYAAIAVLLLASAGLWIASRPQAEKQVAGDNSFSPQPATSSKEKGDVTSLSSRGESGQGNAARKRDLHSGRAARRGLPPSLLSNASAEIVLTPAENLSETVFTSEAVVAETGQISSTPLDSLTTPLPVVSLWKEVAEAESESEIEVKKDTALSGNADLPDARLLFMDGEPSPESLLPVDENKTQLEIQTRDPNIRIIMFIPKEPRRTTGAD